LIFRKTQSRDGGICKNKKRSEGLKSCLREVNWEDFFRKMKIEVLGPGCSKCDNTFEKVKQVVSELKLDAELTRITDVFKIIDRGVSLTPALIINGKIKFQGKVPSIKEIKSLLLEEKS
jgi:small redox-active disulfide protein 2